MCCCSVAQPGLTRSPVDCHQPGSSVYGIFHTRILEWFAISFSRESSLLRDWTHVSLSFLFFEPMSLVSPALEGRFFTDNFQNYWLPSDLEVNIDMIYIYINIYIYFPDKNSFLVLRPCSWLFTVSIVSSVIGILSLFIYTQNIFSVDELIHYYWWLVLLISV